MADGAAPTGRPATIVAHVPNLFDRSRFGGQVTFVDSGAEAAAVSPDLVIVDLDRCEDIEGFVLDGVQVVGFGPHVETTVHQQAVDAGYDEVFARSVFFRRLNQLLESATESDS